MALFDLQSMFSDQQTVATAAGDVVSTNVIDLGAVDTPKHASGPITRDLGKGRPIPVQIQVTETVTSAGAATINFVLEGSDAEGFGSGVVTYAQTGAVALADLVAGAKFGPFYVPEGVNKRYLRMKYVVAGATTTAGKATAGLVFGRSNWTP